MDQEEALPEVSGKRFKDVPNDESDRKAVCDRVMHCERNRCPMRLVKQYGSYEESVFYRERTTVPSPFHLPNLAAHFPELSFSDADIVNGKNRRQQEPVKSTFQLPET
jgi:hypothetical protein